MSAEEDFTRTTLENLRAKAHAVDLQKFTAHCPADLPENLVYALWMHCQNRPALERLAETLPPWLKTTP